jgi:hypothetical protein
MSRRTLMRAPDPHMPPPLAIATRRDLFGSIGALLLLTAAEAGPAKAAELDGELLACCAEALAIDGESDRLWDGAVAVAADATADHSAWQAYNDNEYVTLGEWHDLVRRISDTPARTPEGLRMKAAVARSAMPGERKDEPDPCDRLALSLYEDMLGRAGA